MFYLISCLIYIFSNFEVKQFLNPFKEYKVKILSLIFLYDFNFFYFGALLLLPEASVTATEVLDLLSPANAVRKIVGVNEYKLSLF